MQLKCVIAAWSAGLLTYQGVPKGQGGHNVPGAEKSQQCRM